MRIFRIYVIIYENRQWNLKMSGNTISFDVQASDLQILGNTKSSDVQIIDAPQVPSDLTVLKEVAVTAVMDLLQSVGTPVSDISTAHNLVATLIQQQTAVSTVVAEPIITPSDSAITLDQATITLVNRVGDFLTKAGTSDAPPANVLMQDVQEVWKSKTSTDTFVSTVATFWNAIKSSEHLPVIAGMFASLFVQKK